MIVFDIKRYAINDGPGIRTTLFLKGCPLRCVWCHNPESWRPEPEWLFKAKKCIGCNTCGVYPNQLEWIKQAQHLPDREELEAELCPTLALEICGKDWTIEDLLAEIEKERDVMQDSGGGVTISGGEPFLQMGSGAWKPENEEPQLLTLLREIGLRGIHRAVDTTLYTSAEAVRAVAAETDLFLVDLKVMDPEKHKRFTGVSNQCILDNLRLIAELGTPYQIRIPLIDGVNSDYENIEQTARFIQELKLLSSEQKVNNASIASCKPQTTSSLTNNSLSEPNVPAENIAEDCFTVALLPYHEMGCDKHARRGTTYNPQHLPLSTPSDDTIERCIRQFANHDITAGVGG